MWYNIFEWTEIPFRILKIKENNMDIQEKIGELEKSLKETEEKLVKDLKLGSFREVNIEDFYKDDEIEIDQER